MRYRIRWHTVIPSGPVALSRLSRPTAIFISSTIIGPLSSDSSCSSSSRSSAGLGGKKLSSRTFKLSASDVVCRPFSSTTMGICVLVCLLRQILYTFPPRIRIAFTAHERFPAFLLVVRYLSTSVSCCVLVYRWHLSCRRCLPSVP